MRKCPKCQNEAFNEIVVDAIVSTRVAGIVDGDDLDYCVNPGITNGRIDHYECASCGFVVDIDNPEGFAAWLVGDRSG